MNQANKSIEMVELSISDDMKLRGLYDVLIALQPDPNDHTYYHAPWIYREYTQEDDEGTGYRMEFTNRSISVVYWPKKPKTNLWIGFNHHVEYNTIELIMEFFYNYSSDKPDARFAFEAEPPRIRELDEIQGGPVCGDN